MKVNKKFIGLILFSLLTIFYLKAQELPCEDCCEIGLLVNTDKNFDLLKADIPPNYNADNLSDETKHVLKGTLHSGITVNGVIYDYGLGLRSWTIQQQRTKTKTVSEMMQNEAFQERLEIESFYHLVFTVPKEACPQMIIHWTKLSFNNTEYDPYNYNCHIVSANSLYEVLDETSGVKEYLNPNFSNDGTDDRRWGVFNFRKAYEKLVSTCGEESGKKPRLEIFGSKNANARRGDSEKIQSETDEEEDKENCQCQPEYIDPCKELKRLDLASGSDNSQFSDYITFDLTFQSEGSPLGYAYKYNTTFTELEHSNNGYPLVPKIFTETRTDKSILTYSKVGGVDFTNLDEAAASNRILGEGSYDMITCSNPNAGLMQLPSVQQAFKYLKEGGEFRVSFFDFDFVRPNTQKFVKEFQEIFTNVVIQQPSADWQIPSKPPFADNTNYIISGFKSSKIPVNQRKALPDIQLTATPNPASDILTIKIREELKGAIKLELINNLGSMVKQETLSENTTSIDLNISNLSTGIYLLNAYNENGNVYSEKIVIQ